MRLLVKLKAVADAAYNPFHKHNLRGRIWQCFGDDWSNEHGSEKGIGLSFSNIYPVKDIEKGDIQHVLIASPRDEVLNEIAGDLVLNQEFNIGNMMFTVEDVNIVVPDVGEPGTRGVLETETGVFCAFTKDVAEKHGLPTDKITEGDEETQLYWRQEHGMEPLQDVIRHSLHHSQEWFGDGTYTSPLGSEYPLFTSFEPIKDPVTYPVKFTPSTGVTQTLIVSKWKLAYHVKDQAHRHHLNLALDTGLGQRREHGFGFVNLVEESVEPPTATTVEARRGEQ